jgi:hypothetical protein
LIPIEPQPSPNVFEEAVRHPGQKFLNTGKPLTQQRWRRHNYWTRVFPDLYHAYCRVCAYSCHWIPRDGGAGTVDHFHPKKKYPQLAYEWSNYRLASLLCNSRKREFEDVLDPFTIEVGWFVMDFPSLIVRPGADLVTQRRAQVQSTINRLRLNDEAALETRLSYLRPFCTGDTSLDYLRARAPFIASELDRQKLVERIREIMEPARGPHGSRSR